MSSHEEPKLSIQSFHQHSSLISIKLSTINFLVWKSLILPSICSLGIEHHINDPKRLVDDSSDSAGKKIKNLNLDPWIANDDLLISWLLGNMKEEVLSMIFVYLKVQGICDKLVAIGKPLGDVDKVFQVSQGLGDKYKEFRIAILSKPPYPSFNQFIMSVQNFEQVYLREEMQQLDHNEEFFGQRRRGRGHHGGRGNFRGRGSNSFTQN
ncbi:hypothetical protein Pfo_015520 [Paulownia fortunei]|nr:hypothetical protein Pfo_015520 [Paulownia fortunei]